MLASSVEWMHLGLIDWNEDLFALDEQSSEVDSETLLWYRELLPRNTIL